MKKLMALILAMIMLLSFAGCGGEKGKTEKKMSKSEMLDIAVEIYAHQITADIACNAAKAQTYVGKTYVITGHIEAVEADHCVVLARQMENDNGAYVHSDDWQGYTADMAFLVYLPVEELAKLNVCEGIKFVGTVNSAGTDSKYSMRVGYAKQQNDISVDI